MSLKVFEEHAVCSLILLPNKGLNKFVSINISMSMSVWHAKRKLDEKPTAGKAFMLLGAFSMCEEHCHKLASIERPSQPVVWPTALAV
eukprot:1000149-Pelagomonas_calceolata.AAC.1